MTTDTAVADTTATAEGEHTTDTPDTVDDALSTAEDTDTPEGHGEAAKYRRKLREAEKERDQLAARLEATQRAQAESLITATGVKPAAVWAATNLADVLDDDGAVDPGKVTAAVTAARDSFGINPIGKGAHVPGLGNQPNVPPKTDRWVEAFTGKRK